MKLMKIVRTSRLSGETKHWYMPITQAQMDAWLDGMLIQDAMPHLTANQREFIMTGIPDEWDAAFGEDE
jgi:hypothetical protein